MDDIVFKEKLKDLLRGLVDSKGIARDRVCHISYDLKIMSKTNERIGREIGMMVYSVPEVMNTVHKDIK